MILVNDLTVKYGDKKAIDKLNIAINKGEKVSIVGRSGCGKTSLLHVLAGLITPFEGNASIFGIEVKGIRRGTSIILQKDGLFPWKKVEANVQLGIINETGTKEEKSKRTDEILTELGIFDQKGKYIHEISGGERQRVAIARAMIQAPDVLLMDEPTGSLDMITKEIFQDNLHELYDRRDMTTVTVTHDIEEAVYLGQRILVLEDGKIIQEIVNPLYGELNIRESIEFYKLCLKIRKVMKG
jgi:NitT/TauT family transport system ATP-binding protein